MGIRQLLRGFGSGAPRGTHHRAESSARRDVAPIERRPCHLPEKRSADTGDLTNRLSIILESPSSSGVNVNERSALGVGAVVACVQILSVMTAKLPIYLYRPTSGGPKEIEKHPAMALLSGVPSELHTNFELRSLMMTGCGLGGNGYGRVYRDSMYDPRAIEWLAPADVNPQLIKRPSGERFVSYEVNGVKDPLTRADIIHVRSPICLDGVSGMSPVRMLRESIGTSLSQTAAAGKLMKNGTRFPGVVSTPASMSKDKLQAASDEFNQGYAGALNAGRTLFLAGGMTYTETQGMTMVDAEFVESRRMEIHEVARHYGIPAFMVDSTATSTWGAGIEQQMLGFMNLSLDSWLVNWEQALAFTLLTAEEIRKGYHFKFDRDQLANVAPATRAAFYTAMRNNGAYSPNDIRRKENEPLISKEDGGDTYGNPNTSSPSQQAPAPAQEPAPATA